MQYGITGERRRIAATPALSEEGNVSWRQTVKGMLDVTMRTAHRDPTIGKDDPRRPSPPLFCGKLMALLAIPEYQECTEYMPALAIALKVGADGAMLDPTTTKLGLDEIKVLKVARSNDSLKYAEAGNKLSRLVWRRLGAATPSSDFDCPL